MKMPRKIAYLLQSMRFRSPTCSHPRIACPRKSIGMPGLVSTGAARGCGLRDRRIALHVLRDRDLPGLARLHLVIDPAQEIPAPAGQVVRIVEAIVVVAVHVPDVNGRIEAQPVRAIFLKPHQGVVPDELADFRTPVIRSILFAPWRPGPPV